MEKSMPTFTAERLTNIAIDVFKAVGVSETEARIVSGHLVDANLAGVDSHGVIRISQYVRNIQAGKIVPGLPIEVTQETSSTALINGNWGLGQVIAQRAMVIAIQKARTNGISAVSVYQCTHAGRLASHTMMAADEGMIGVMVANAGGSGKIVAPFGGVAGRLATNPISVALPTGRGEHIVLDMATSAVSEGKIRVKKNRGEQVPEGWIIDHQGRSASDLGDFYGPLPMALLPLGGVVGYKGFGLGFVIDILAGGLSGAGCGRTDAPPRPRGNGILILVIDIQRFAPMDAFYQHVTGLIDYVKSSPLAPGFDEIQVPGEPEVRERGKRLKDGIVIDEGTWGQIREILEELGLSQCNGSASHRDL